MEKLKLNIPVRFEGTIEVRIPYRSEMPNSHAYDLARKVALARILATTDNPDAPEDDAFEDYKNEVYGDSRRNAEADWDATEIIGVNGTWTHG